MSTTIGARSVMLAAASPRLLASANARINVKTNTPVFHVNTSGVSDPTSINFTATFDEMEGTVTWSASGATLTSISGNTCTLLPANMPGTSATVTATMTYRGTVFSTPVSISKVVDGSVGVDGARGAGNYYATGGSWSDATANTATPGANVLDDVVTISDGSTFVNSKRWNGSAWVAIGTVIDGTLLVTKSITTAKLATNAVTADKISVGTTDNIVPDPGFIDLTWWDRVGHSVSDYTGSNTFWKTGRPLVINAATGAFKDSVTQYFPSTPGAVYRMEFQVYITSDFVGKASIYMHIPNDSWHAMGGPTRGYNWGDGLPVMFDGDGPDGAQTFSAIVTLPDNSYSSKLQVRLKSECTAGSIEIGSVSCTRVSNNVLIQDGAITADKITVSNLAAISAELGSAVISTTGSLRSGQTAYATGTGWWLGFVSGVPKFSIGSSTQYLRWTGTTLEFKINQIVVTALSDLSSPSGSNGTRIYGTRTATITSGGVAPFTYNWYLGYSDGISIVDDTTATVEVSGTATNDGTSAKLICTVTDSNGLTATVSCIVSGVHGTPP